AGGGGGATGGGGRGGGGGGAPGRARARHAPARGGGGGAGPRRKRTCCGGRRPHSPCRGARPLLIPATVLRHGPEWRPPTIAGERTAGETDPARLGRPERPDAALPPAPSRFRGTPCLRPGCPVRTRRRVDTAWRFGP